MRVFRVFTLLCCIPAVFAGTGPAAAGDAAADLVRRVSGSYSNLENYHFEGSLRMTTSMMGMSQGIDARVVIAGKSPGRTLFRLDHDIVGMRIVSDGEYTWTWMATGNQYTRKAAIPVRTEAGPSSPESAGSMGESTAFLSMYAELDSGLVTPVLIGSEVVESGGRAIECDVVQINYTNVPELNSVMGPDTLWVDAPRALVVRSRGLYRGTAEGYEMKVMTALDFDTMEPDHAPDDSLFVFAPPEGATEVERFGPGGVPAVDLTGKYAADFALPGLDGRTRRLEDSRGQVVLINFWATWCAPCREELPLIEKLHGEYRDRGLVVLVITTEPKHVAGPFVKEYDYSFPVLIDEQGETFDAYRVNSIPVVVVVGRDGVIVAHFVGLQDEAGLVEALAAAGIR